MRRYANSKLRVILLAVLVGAAVVTMASGQETPAPPAAAAVPEASAERQGLTSIILGNIDFVFVLIMLLSVAGLTLIIQGFIKNREAVFMPQSSTSTIREMIANKQFKELIEFTEADASFVSRSLNPALKRAPSFSAMKEAMETAVGEQTADQFRRIEYLNIIGNLGPLLGLLGTVLGMIEAFSAMQAAGGQANPAQLAGGISKALAHTFMGLLLAVPCLAAFGVLRTLVDRLTVRGALVAEEMLLMIKPTDGKAPVATPVLPPGVTMPPPPTSRKPATSPAT
jgi:biopolymer transport protein ExbB